MKVSLGVLKKERVYQKSLEKKHNIFLFFFWIPMQLSELGFFSVGNDPGLNSMLSK